MYGSILILWRLLGEKRRIAFYCLIALTVFSSITEVISIGALLPFLTLISNQKSISGFESISNLGNYFGFQGFHGSVLFIGILFCSATLISGTMRLITARFGIRLAFACGADLGARMFKNALNQPYLVQISKNSSSVLDAILTKSNQVTSTLFQVVSLVSSTIMLIVISGTLIYIDPVITICAFIFFSLFYIVIIYYVKDILEKNSSEIADRSKTVVKSVQEGLGGIREIIIYRLHDIFISIFTENDRALRFAQGENQFISACPRFVIEPLSIVIFTIVLIVLTWWVDDLNKIIPLLATLIMGSQKILPLLQNAYANFSGIKGGQDSLNDALELLRNEPINKDKTPAASLKNEVFNFENNINIENAFFKYEESNKFILNGLNLKIKKGSKVGIIGGSGAGKSTLVDVMMGLIELQDGVLTVDGEKISEKNITAWRSQIAHVPQAIFLIDGTIAENIAFGEAPESVNFLEVMNAAKLSKLSELIASWPQGYETRVGERGIKISGGQRQRLGLARALYKNRKVIVLDEATSSLDYSSEIEVMSSIENLGSDLTLIIVAHRLSTLKICDMIVEIKDGVVSRLGSYRDIIEEI